MKLIQINYLPYQFVILPAIGVIKRHGGVYRYLYRLSIVWGFWGISVGLGKPLY